MEQNVDDSLQMRIAQVLKNAAILKIYRIIHKFVYLINSKKNDRALLKAAPHLGARVHGKKVI
jgi:hypothetical protein